MVKCLGCDAEFAPSTRNPRKWCSEPCRVAKYRADHPDYVERNREAEKLRVRVKVQPSPRACRMCGDVFSSVRPEATVCSKRCRNASQRHLRKERRDKELWRPVRSR
jgi:hypothetical protein